MSAKREVHLYGALRKYGPVINMNISSPIEAFRALFANYPDTREVVKNGSFKIVVGEKKATGKELGEDELELKGTKPIHIMPAIKGRGGRGTGKIVAGIAIMAIAYYAAPLMYAGADAAFMAQAGVVNYANMGASIGLGVTYGGLAGVGASLALAGAYQLLSPTPKAQEYGAREAPDQRSSFLYNGPVNTVEQGAAIPLVYGKMRVGSVLVSAGLSVEQI